MADVLTIAQRRLIVRVALMGTSVGWLCIATQAGQDAKDPFEVGQQWEYRHEGPRPGSVEPNAINGERIMQVIAVVEKPEGKQWIIEERFTKDEKVVGRIHVNGERLVTMIEIENEKGETAKLKYDPPVPHQVTALNVDEEKTIETSLKMDSMNLTIPSTTVIRRLDDETITTPAGEFADCLHFMFATKSTLDVKIAKIPFTEERERWYHPRVNGLVKEVYRKGPVKFFTWSREGYTATSVLTAFGKKEVPAGTRITNEVNKANPQKGRNRPLSRAPGGKIVLSMALGTVAVLVMVAYILMKRLKPNIVKEAKK